MEFSTFWRDVLVCALVGFGSGAVCFMAYSVVHLSTNLWVTYNLWKYEKSKIADLEKEQADLRATIKTRQRKVARLQWKISGIARLAREYEVFE